MKPPSASWPLRHTPLVRNAGEFPMTIPACNKSYRHGSMALHLHDYRGDFWIGQTHYRLQPGDLTLSSSGSLSRYRLAESGRHLCIHFEPVPPARTGRTQLPPHYRLGPLTAAARERIWRIIGYYREAGHKRESLAACAASSALQELLLWLRLQRRTPQTFRRPSLLEESLLRLRQAIDDSVGQSVTVPELAAGVGLSAGYVTRLFNQRYGMTIPHYLLLRKIELARHLLITSDCPVQQIGREVGIPDPQYFNKQFRRIVGQSPSHYRAGGKS